MRSIVIIILCLLMSLSSLAKNLGVWGTVYPISEPDLETYIYQRIQKMQQNGQYAQFKKQFIQNVKKHILRPAPVSGLTTTDHPKTFFYDPTFVLTHNILGPDGNVLFKKGKKINPFKKVHLHEVLFFLNSDDKRQIKWAQKERKKYDFVKFILVKGNIKEVEKQLKNRVYFDQYGILTQKLGIRHIPCIVKQRGKKLQIQEYSLKKYENKK